MKQIRVMITGGGTGGHLSPGAAIYEEMKAREMRPVFLAGKTDRRFSIMNSISPRDLVYYRAPSFTHNIIRMPFFLVSFFLAFLKAFRLIGKRRISAVLGMGGYVSGPALLAAKVRGIPVFLCEQNTVPGRVTSMFEKKALRIYGTFQSTADYLVNREAFVFAGNPVRKHVLENVSREEARKFFHLEQCRKVLLVIGGSQGAVRLNRLTLELIQKYGSELQNTGIIWSTGAGSYSEFREKMQGEKSGSVYMSEYIDRVGLAYRASDLAVSRAGSGVMMEMAAAGLPSVLIRYPFAALDHQNKNADEFCSAGASVKIPDAQATAEKAAPVILDLLSNERKLAKMSEKNLASAKTDAAAVIVDDICSVLNELD